MNVSPSKYDLHATPLVSVVIPCYNFGHLISYTLDSLLAQSYTNWECILVDDGSVDDTADVIAKYVANDTRFRYHKQQNSGPAKARNTGIELATGEWLQFLDADDLLNPDKLSYQIGVLLSDSTIDVIYSDTLHFTTSNSDPSIVGELTPDTVKRPQVSGTGNIVVKTFLEVTFFPSAGLIRHSVVKELGMLDERLIQSEDWDLFLRAAQIGAVFKYLADSPRNAAALIRRHESNNTGNFFRLVYYVVRMREKFNANCTDAHLKQFNNSILLKDLENLVLEVEIDLVDGKRKRAIERSFKILELKLSMRYLLYAFASIILPATLYGKLIRFSFTNLFRA